MRIAQSDIDQAKSSARHANISCSTQRGMGGAIDKGLAVDQSRMKGNRGGNAGDVEAGKRGGGCRQHLLRLFR